MSAVSSLPSSAQGPLLRPPRLAPLLAGWALFWLLMITIAVQAHLQEGYTDLWRPLLWEGSSCAMATTCAAFLWRWVPRADGHLAHPLRWFRLALLQLLWMAPLFVAAIYAIRHGVYALVGEVYRHPPWAQVLLHESLRFGLFYALFAAVVFGVRAHAALQAEGLRAERALTLAREAQLAQLAQQMQPHFLFNALNTIAEVVHVDAAQAEALLLRLSALLRVATELTRRPLVPLSDELALVEGYAAIMRERFAGRLVLTIDADPAATAVEVPSLCLQPLLENAFVHGVERCAGPAEVRVSARLVAPAILELQVRCNLGTVDPSAPDGVGLGTLRERLAAARGEAASLVLEAQPGGGSVATLRWPMRGG